MGVYIRGIEMPTSCDACPMMTEYYGCVLIGAVGYTLTQRERCDRCPLAPVPQHGDLIDRDMVLKKAWDVETFVDALKYAPTIIPAEGAKNARTEEGE